MPLQQGQLGIKRRFFDRQCGQNAGLFWADGGDSGDGLGAIEGDAVMLDSPQVR